MARRDRLVRQTLRCRYVVTLKSGATFDGVLFDADESSLVMVGAESLALSGRGETVRTRVDGHLVLFRAEVDYMQLPPGAG